MRYGRITAAIAAALATVCLCTTAIAARNNEVTVRVAPYYTQIADMSVYSPEVEYPVFTYKSVTYIPLTQSLASRLELAVDFDPEKGLFINSDPAAFNGVSLEDKPFGGIGPRFYRKSYKAVIPKYHVYINGIYYNSFKEEYPLLNYGGITYLPLTYDLACTELGLEMEFTSEGFFLDRAQDRHSFAYMRTAKNGDKVIVKERVERMEKDICLWWERYKLHSGTDYLEHLGTHTDFSQFSDEYYPLIKPEGENENIYAVTDTDGTGKSLYYKGEKIDTIPQGSDYYGREYIFDGTTFIYVNVYLNNAPAPYTFHEEYIYVKTADGTKKLSWDVKSNLARILPDGIGGYYLCSDTYSPAGSSRWSNGFAHVSHYKSDGTFVELTVGDANSITGYGVHGGKLYIKAARHTEDKSTMLMGLLKANAASSGFYAVDVRTDEAEYLYPYIFGDCFMVDDGGFYCIYERGTLPRVINLKNGRIIPVE